MREPEQLANQQQPERQPPSRRMFFWLLLALMVFIAGFLILNSSVFTVRTVLVQGNKYMPEEDVHRVANLPEQTNIFRLNVTEITERLSHDLRIAEAEITRSYPDTIIIHLIERKPLAYIANSYGFVEVDKQGVILAVYKNLKNIRVPVITGIRLESGYIGDRVQNNTIDCILEYLSYLDENTLDQLSELNITGEQLFAYTNDSVQIRVGTKERLEEKAKLTQDMLKEITGKNLVVDYIDLNFASPVIKFKQ